MPNIRNYYELLVIDQLSKVITSSQEPLSQTFLDDVACLALNQLPSCYVRNTIDKGITLSESKYHEMSKAVDEAVRMAILQVRRHPHDNREY